MTKLAVLRHDEGVRLDPNRLVALFSELGDLGAEEVVENALEVLASRLADVQRHAETDDTEALGQSIESLINIAEQIGLTSFAAVAGDVMLTSKAGDLTGQRATLARLQRIGNRSLTAVWDLRDMTM